jgi:hypothetical protein
VSKIDSVREQLEEVAVEYHCLYQEAMMGELLDVENGFTILTGEET